MKKIGFVALTALFIVACGPSPASVRCVTNAGTPDSAVFFEKTLANGTITFDDGLLTVVDYSQNAVGVSISKTIPTNATCDITNTGFVSTED